MKPCTHCYKEATKEKYRSIQDMTVDYITTKKAITRMEEINEEVKRTEDKIDRRQAKIFTILGEIESHE